VTAFETRPGVVVFADLSGFSPVVDPLDEQAYLAFMTDFRGVVFACLAPRVPGNLVQWGFWGDEVKAIFYGGDMARNARDGVRFAADLQAAWERSKIADGMRFKIGVATGDVTVGPFAGATAPEIEARALLVARTLSKWAKFGAATRIYLDAATCRLLDPARRVVRVPDQDAWELERLAE
jgi:class 3 adenylate cyclase